MVKLQNYFQIMILIVCRLIVIIIDSGKIIEVKSMPEYSKQDLKILKKFGAPVRARRDELDISQEELAERAGLHRTYIGGVEQGRRNLSLLNIIKITKALKVRPGEMMDATERGNSKKG